MQAEISSQWKTGEVILNLYQILDILGEGGFGKVYQVRHTNWNIDLAIKILKPEIVAVIGGIENFEREAQTWVNLGLHPHIVSCYYVRRWGNNPLIFAEYVAGGSLQDWISSRQLYDGGTKASLQRILDISIQFAWGLHYAHEQGLIHQDVKPGNVMMTPKGVAKVTDFGLSNYSQVGTGEILLANEEWGENSDRTLSVKGSGGMTPAYCSPEQAFGETLTRRSDMWSWGLSILEMFQGQRTWPIGTIAAQALEFYLDGEKDPQLPQMPISVAELLRGCFRENSDERPHTMLEVAFELQQIYQNVTEKVYPRREFKAGKDTADSLNNRAVSLLDLGRKEEALQLWEAALSLQPHHPESTYNRGLVRWRYANIDDDTLVKELEEMQNSQPDNWLGNYFTSLVHLERDDCEAAIAQLINIKIEDGQQEEVAAARAEAEKRLPQSKRSIYDFLNHSKRVNSVSFSRDGKSVVFGKHDGSLELYSFVTKKYHAFEGHPGEGIKSVCFSPDNRYVVSLSNLTLKLWEITTNNCLYNVNVEKPKVRNLHDRDERFYFSYAHGLFTLQEKSTGNIIYRFNRGGSEVFSISDRHFLLLDGQPKLVEVSTGEIRQTFDGHTRQVNAISISPNQRFFISGSEDTTLKLWEIATGRCLRTFKGHRGAVRAVCISPDGRFALSAGDTTLKWWELQTGRCRRTFAIDDLVYAVDISPDSRVAVSGGNSTLKLWAVNSRIQPYVAPMMLCRVQAAETIVSVQQIYDRELAQAKDKLKQGDAVGAAECIRKVRSLPGYSRDPEAFKIWTQLYLHLPRKAFISGWESATFTGHTGHINSICLSFDGQYALSGSSDNTLKLWDVEQGTCIRTFEGYFQGTLNSVCLSSDSQYALSGSSAGTLKLWEIATGKAVQSFEGYAAGADTVCLTPDGRFAVSGNHEGILKLWESTTGRCLRSWKAHRFGVSSVFLSADGQYLLSGETEHRILGEKSEKKLKVWDLATGLCYRTFVGHQSGVTSVCLSLDGRFALSGSEDKTLKLWDMETGNCLRTFEGHQEAVTSVCLSADGHFALSGSEDKTLKLWEVETGCCLRTFEGHASTVKSVCLSADGRFALSGSDDGSLKKWALDWELEDKVAVNWDEGARVYLENFLTLNTPYAVNLESPYLLETEQGRQEQNKAIYVFLTSVFAIVWSITVILVMNGRLLLFIAGLIVGGMTGWKYAKLALFIWLNASLADRLIISLLGADINYWILLCFKLILYAGAASVGIVIGAIAKKVLPLDPVLPVKNLLNKAFNWQEFKKHLFSNKVHSISNALSFGITIIFAIIAGINSEYVKFVILPILASNLYLTWMGNTKKEVVKYLHLQRNHLIKSSIIAVIVAIILTSFKPTVLSTIGFIPSTNLVCRNINAAKDYLEMGGNPNDLTFRFHTIGFLTFDLPSLDPILECAIDNDKKDVVELLINKGAKINMKNARRDSFLHIALRKGNADIAEMLIAKGIDINAKDRFGYDAMYYILNGKEIKLINKIKLVKMLVIKGIEIDGEKAIKIMLLSLESWQDEPDLSEALISKITNINYQSAKGLTLLHRAIMFNKLATAKILIERGIDINAQDARGYTSLHLAVENRNKAAIGLLITHGADIGIPNKFGYTPLDLANGEIIRWIDTYYIKVITEVK